MGSQIGISSGWNYFPLVYHLISSPLILIHLQSLILWCLHSNHEGLSVPCLVARIPPRVPLCFHIVMFIYQSAFPSKRWVLPASSTCIFTRGSWHIGDAHLNSSCYTSWHAVHLGWGVQSSPNTSELTKPGLSPSFWRESLLSMR